jgi:predicted phage-related endonuclease
LKSQLWRRCYDNRRFFIGGSDARIIMGSDEAALLRLWREKRGEADPEDLSGNLVVQLGVATEELNRSWYERNTGKPVTDVQRPSQAFGHSLDGGDPRRHRRWDRGRV